MITEQSMMGATGLALTIFNNTALFGPPLATSTVATPLATFSGLSPFSATLVGTLSVERGFRYNFTCHFGDAVLGYAHIDGHLVCQTGINGPRPPTPPSVRSSRYDTPLPVLTSTEWPVRFSLVHNGTGSADAVVFGMDIAREADAESAAQGTAPQGDVPQSGMPPAWLHDALSPTLPAVEVQRDEMQSRLASGWGLWYDMSFTKLVRLPEGSTISLVLCEPSQGDGGADDMPNATVASCATETRTDWAPAGAPDVTLRPGAHAYDRSYAQLYVATPSCNVSIEVGGGDRLLVHATVVSGCAAAELVLVGGSAWHRMHEIAVSTPSSLALRPTGTGLRTSDIFATAATQSALVLPASVASQPHLALRLGGAGGRVGVASEGALAVGDIDARLQAAWSIEQGRYARYGDHAEAKMAVQAGVMWNVVYNPLERVIAPVIRGNPWTWDEGSLDDDWPYVLFDWDTHFAAYMLSLDARELGYSVLIQVLTETQGP